MGRKFENFMLHVTAGTNEKLAILTDSEYRAHISGILAVAATSPIRGRLLVGDMEAEPKQVAMKAGVSVAAAKKAMDKMKKVGVLYRDEELNCWAVHDWEEHNPEPRLGDRTAARRQALHRNGALRDALRERDGDACRYCGCDVDFADRRSPKGGTYDHVDPAGDNTMENLVVACRGCNSSKGSRTPREAGLTLKVEPICAGVRNGSTREQIRADEVEVEGEEKKTPKPPDGGFPEPPRKPTSGRRREVDDYDRLVGEYAAWLLPDLAEPHRTQTVRSALGGAVAPPMTNERVAEWVRRFEQGAAA